MYRSPNEKMKQKDNKLFDPYELGENQISKKFKYALNVFLTSEYYEGTNLGKIYNERRSDGRSKIYVDQPKLEDKLHREFIDVDDDIIKFLVGYTGVGKTTLLRNVFQVFDREINVVGKDLIIYVSFYAMPPAPNDEKKEAVQSTIINALDMVITHLSGKDYVERLLSYDDEYYQSLYTYINDNNKLLIHSYRNSPDFTTGLSKDNIYKKILSWIERENPLDYTLSQLKFYLHNYEKTVGHKLENIVLIFDDIETKSIEYHNEIIEFAFHIKKCLQAYRNRKYNFKILITLRNYSFRIQQIRLKEAFRAINKNDIILKDTVPSLSEVIETRINYVLGHKEVLEKVNEIDSWETAARNLKIILSRLYGQYDKMLLSLTHNNIFKSMNLIMRIVTNKRHLGKYEIFNDGSFKIDADKYNLRNYSNNESMPKNDDVFNSLVYGESEAYQDIGDYYLTNILHYKKKDNIDTELMGIYIIQFLHSLGIYMGNENYDGLKTKEGREVVIEIADIFNLSEESEKRDMLQGLNAMMKRLYEGGVLLQSIVEPKKEDDNSFSREYIEELQVYLSLRGYQLYHMLMANSLLFEAYRDDIDTDLEENDIKTLELSKYQRIKYCINYTSHLFRKEMRYLCNVEDKRKYEECFGKDIVSVVLMKGLRESIYVYYSSESTERTDLINKHNELGKEINDFLQEIYVNDTVEFTKIELINM